MDRREAIKNISLALGYTLSAPVLMNILTSCNTNKEITKFLYFTNQEAFIVKNYIRFILDEEHFPLAKNMNLHAFVDQLFFYTEPKNDKEFFKQTSLVFHQKFIQVFNKKPIEASFNEYDIFFKTFHYHSEEKKQRILKILDKNINDINSKSEKNTYLIYHFFLTIREKSLLGYCTSEEFLKQ